MRFQNLLLLLGCFFSANLLYAQTLLFGGANGNGDFENGTTGWTLVNGTQTNKWVVSSNATAGFSGANCIYISSSSNAPYAHQYDVTANTYSYFYKDVPIPAGAKRVWLVFDYICNGEWINDPFNPQVNDGLRIYARNTSTAITPGDQLPGSFFLPGAYYNQGTWKRKEVRYLDVTGFAGSAMRVIFQWNSNNSQGVQPPAAIDNIEMYAGCEDMMYPTLSSVAGSSVTLAWNTISGATGYQIRYRKLDEPATVVTYTSPVTVNGGNTYFTTLNGLLPGTAYLAEIRPAGTGSTCTEFSAPLVFETLPQAPNDECAGAIALSVESNACGGMQGSFLGATASSGLPGACTFSSNNDVWFRFVATAPKQILQTVGGETVNDALGISLFTGSCSSLQAVTLPCAATSYSPVFRRTVARLEATGLTVGTTYYVRVNAGTNSTTGSFKICVYNEPPAATCPALVSPANNLANVNAGVPVEFKWRTAAEAKGYRLRIVQQSGAYAEIYTSDTSYSYFLEAGINYTWNVASYNIQDQLTTCGSGFALTTCPAISNTSVLTASSSEKCVGDSIKIKAAPSAPNLQWFLDGQPIAGATADSIWATAPGVYTVRVVNGSCYSAPSNAITISNLATPVKPTITAGGVTTFCQGGTVTLTASLNVNNQWFNGTTAVTGANGQTYAAGQSGHFYVRVMNSSSGCYNYSDTIAVTVKPIPAAPTVAALSATTFCAGDSVKLEASATQSLQWYKNGTAISGATSRVLNVTEAGNYTVTTAENGCTSNPSAQTTVTVNAIPATPTITANGNLTFCTGDSVRLQSSATAGNQWFKNDLAIGAATGQQFWAKEAASYTVKVTANNCTSSPSAAAVTTLNPLPAQPTITRVGSLLSVPAGYASYKWYFNNNLIASATANEYTTTQNGLYKVEVTNANGCKIMSPEFNQVSTAVNEVVWTDYSIRLYPNPVLDKLTVQVSARSATGRVVMAEIFAANGKLVSSVRLKAGANNIPFAGLPQGIYAVILKNGTLRKAVQVVKTN